MGTMFVATGTPLTNVRLKVSLQLYLITPASDIVQLRAKGFLLLGARASGQRYQPGKVGEVRVGVHRRTHLHMHFYWCGTNSNVYETSEGTYCIITRASLFKKSKGPLYFHMRLAAQH